MRHFLATVLLVLTGCAAASTVPDKRAAYKQAPREQAAGKQAAKAPGEVAVNDEAGGLTSQEAYLLSGLKQAGVLLPDSISIQRLDALLGSVERIAAPRTVKLAERRTDYPDLNIPQSYPYLFGRDEKPAVESGLFGAYVLAHEIGHIHGPRLNPEMGRPALGLSPQSDEVQADILALLYMRRVFGVSREDLGYPATVSHPHISDPAVKTLVWKYCLIVNKTESWGASLDCQR